jgi:hypothetical protein
VVEINQARALAGGVTPGDAAGFPVSISQPGAYRLTGSLTVPDANTTAIQLVNASDVTIDLGGFEIRGPGTCVGNTSACLVSGTGAGVHAGGGHNVTVRNGVVRGVGGIGLRLHYGGRVEDVTSIGNAAYGIACSDYCVVEKSTARLNGLEGIFVMGRSIVRDSVAISNLQSGIRAEIGLVEHNVAEANAGYGIVAAAYCRIHANAARGNTLDGIWANTSAVIDGNTVNDNSRMGIVAGAGSTVTGNSVYSNTGFGLKLGSGSGYGNNVLNANNANTETQIDNTTGATYFSLGVNVCQNDTTCP